MEYYKLLYTKKYEQKSTFNHSYNIDTLINQKILDVTQNYNDISSNIPFVNESIMNNPTCKKVLELLSNLQPYYMDYIPSFF